MPVALRRVLPVDRPAQPVPQRQRDVHVPLLHELVVVMERVMTMDRPAKGEADA